MLRAWEMSESTVVPLLEDGANDLSVIAGASEEFDLRSLLKSATAVRIAMAFGHESGWKEIEEDLRHSSAGAVHILLGQAFFRTEPPLLLKIKHLQETSHAPKFEVKLASAQPARPECPAAGPHGLRWQRRRP
jgi:hypothetical protein